MTKDQDVIDDFGKEWSRFQQVHNLSNQELERLYLQLFLGQHQCLSF